MKIDFSTSIASPAAAAASKRHRGAIAGGEPAPGDEPQAVAVDGDAADIVAAADGEDGLALSCREGLDRGGAEDARGRDDPHGPGIDLHQVRAGIEPENTGCQRIPEGVGRRGRSGGSGIFGAKPRQHGLRRSGSSGRGIGTSRRGDGRGIGLRPGRGSKIGGIGRTRRLGRRRLLAGRRLLGALGGSRNGGRGTLGGGEDGGGQHRIGGRGDEPVGVSARPARGRHKDREFAARGVIGIEPSGQPVLRRDLAGDDQKARRSKALMVLLADEEGADPGSDRHLGIGLRREDAFRDAPPSRSARG